MAADESETTRNTQGAGAALLQQGESSESSKHSMHSDAGKSAEMKSSMKPGDAKSFIREAAEGNAAEVALAQVAERKAQNQEVKQFASMLREHHSEANQQLRPIAQAHGVPVTPSLDSKHQEKLSKLQQLSGSEFDKEYMTAMLKDHQKDISKYQQAAQHIQEADVKQYAQSTLPKLRQHLEQARQAARAAGLDQETISSLSRESTDAMGGTLDTIEKESGVQSSGSVPKQD